jgi:hypothetical protein
MSKELDNRRQNARDSAALTADRMTGQYYRERASLEAAITAATRVQITHEVILAFIQDPDDGAELGDIAGPLRAAFRAAGFEVVE